MPITSRIHLINWWKIFQANIWSHRGKTESMLPKMPIISSRTQNTKSISNILLKTSSIQCWKNTRWKQTVGKVYFGKNEIWKLLIIVFINYVTTQSLQTLCNGPETQTQWSLYPGSWRLYPGSWMLYSGSWRLCIGF